jgi:DnaD/phage-associated family protein
LCTLHFDLGIECDALMLMINYCRSRRRLSIRELERLGYQWSDSGILTYDRAAQLMDELKEKNSRVSQIMGLFGLYNRRPSDTEREFIEKWIGLGFDNDMLKLAYERMTERIHEVSFPYLNAILERWAAAGVTTREKAEQERRRRAEQALADAASSAAPSDDALEAQVLSAFEKKRHNRELRQQRRLEELIRKSEEFAALEKQMRLCSSQAARASGERRQALLEEKESILLSRRNLLESMGYSPDWLDNTPDCPLCGDRGFVGANKCLCLKKAVAELKKQQKIS